MRHALIKGVALTLSLLLAFSLMPTRSALAAGDVSTNEVSCSETGTLVESGIYIRAGGISSCSAPVPFQTMTVTLLIDFAPVKTGTKTCNGVATCTHELAPHLKLPGGHVYCSQVTVAYADSISNYEMECDWFWF
jgi:hypothetical protein